MTKRQKAVLVGMVLGDAYLQKTGKKNARIRLEHSVKQREYLEWKAKQFSKLFQGKPSELKRFNPVFGKEYRYLRWQSNSSPQIGEFQRLFYQQGKKTIPDNISSFLTEPVSLAVWFMDDGFLYHRDKMAYIYLPKISPDEALVLLTALRDNFALEAKLKVKKNDNKVLIFSVAETNKLMQLIKKYIIASMSYKLINPVSTEGNHKT